MKNAKGICLTLALCMGLSPVASAATSIQAAPNQSKIYVDGKEVRLSAYTIKQNNYFKLRDLAYVLSDSHKQFDVTWDNGMGAVKIVPNRAYSTAGHTLTSSAGAGKATPSFNTFLYGGKEIALTAYDIGGNNFVKLRDVGKLLNCSVEWDAATNAIVVDSSKGYTEESGLSQEAKKALQRVTYYGDRSKCTISQKQMEAYGQKLLDECGDIYETPEETDVFLADLENNGNPYLVVSRPAPGIGAYAPVVYSYVNGKVQMLCDCWDGSASGGYVSWQKDGRVLYTEWETNDTTGWRNDISNKYYTFFNGELVEYTEPKEGEWGSEQASPTLYELCYPGFEESERCTNVIEAANALLEAGRGSVQTERGKMAAAMLEKLTSSNYANLAQAQLIDLNGDGMEELFVLDSFSANLYYWQNGKLMSKETGIWAGGALNWYLCRDTATGELGIEYESIGGGDFSGGSHTFYYLSHTTETTQAEYEAAAARNVRMEALGGDTVSVTNHRDETRAALQAMLK